jgi:ankyrin repeat protein
MRAARSNDIEVLARQIADGADVNEVSKYGWTALMFAAWKGHSDPVRRLLDAGADPNVVSKRITGNTQAPTPKTTALAQAIENEHIAIAFTLLEHGAVADPIAFAIAGGLPELSLLEAMHARGADPNQKSGVMYYPSALTMACGSGRLANVEWLIDHGALPDLDALMAAVGADQLDMVRYLIALDADPRVFSEEDVSTAFFHAATKLNTEQNNFDQNLQIIAALLRHGADRNHRPSSGPIQNQTVLEFLEQRRVEAVERIRLNRYGNQAYDKAWLEHRDAIATVIGG